MLGTAFLLVRGTEKTRACGSKCCWWLEWSTKGSLALDGDRESQERFACHAHGRWCLFPLAREIRVVSRHLNASVVSYLVELLSRNEPRCELPAMAFLVEVSLMASAASLSCFPPLCPLVAAAAWGAQSVGVGQRVGSSVCPWPPAAGGTLASVRVLCPPCASSRSCVRGSS